MAEAPAPSRRRRSVAPADAVIPDEISDLDLTRAVSQAAVSVGPAIVKALIAEFAVERPQQLKPGVRREFLDRVAALEAE